MQIYIYILELIIETLMVVQMFKEMITLYVQLWNKQVFLK